MPRVIFSTKAYVYVMADGNGRHKIGLSSHPHYRCYQLLKVDGIQVELLHGVQFDRGKSAMIERMAQILLEDKRDRPGRDWFHVSLVEAIKAVDDAIAAYDAGDRPITARQRADAIVAARRNFSGAMEEKAVKSAVHIPESLAKRVDDWRVRQPKIPSRSEALRTLLSLALDFDEALLS
ncbi:GIY-YIG nuclease family protein [Methylobacterium aquaticum]|nr:GIY-YIG nuclease family protein [Methylobacterium aquaticum]